MKKIDLKAGSILRLAWALQVGYAPGQSNLDALKVLWRLSQKLDEQIVPHKVLLGWEEKERETPEFPAGNFSIQISHMSDTVTLEFEDADAQALTAFVNSFNAWPNEVWVWYLSKAIKNWLADE